MALWVELGPREGTPALSISPCSAMEVGCPRRPRPAPAVNMADMTRCAS